MATADRPHSSRGQTASQTFTDSRLNAEGIYADLLELLDLTEWIYFGLDPAGHLIEVSPRLAQLLSTSPDALAGKSLSSLCLPPYDALLSEYLFPAGAPHTTKLNPDRLRLHLSLVPPHPPENLDHTADIPASKERRVLPADLILAFTSSETASQVNEGQVAIRGLLRLAPGLPPNTTETGSTEAEISVDNESRRIQHQLRVISRMGQLVSAERDFDGLLSDLLGSLQMDLGYHSADAYFLSNDKTQVILHSSSVGMSPGHAGPTSGLRAGDQFDVSPGSLLEIVVDSGEAVLVNDVEKNPYNIQYLLHPGARSLLAAPLDTSEGVAGVLIVQSHSPDAFTLDDAVSLQILADQTAFAIQSNALLAERDQRLAELSALNQIGMLLASPGQLVDTLDAIIQHVCALFQVEAASLMLVEDDKLHFKVAAGTHLEQIKPYTLEIGQGIAGWVVQHNQTARVDDVVADPRHFSGIDQTISFDTRSLIAAPLRIATRFGDAPGVQVEERVLGVIEIINRLDGRPFTRKDEVLIEFIASSAAVVIENVRLFNELQRRLSETWELQRETQRRVDALATLGRASQAINRALSLSEVLDAAVEAAGELMRSSAGTALMLKEVDSPHLHVAAFHGLEQAALDALGLLRVAESRYEAVSLLSDSLDSTLQTQEQARLFPLIGVPLRGMQEAIGLIVVNEALPTDETCRLLQTLGDMVAIAIEKARLHEETSRRLAEVSTLYTLANQVTTVLELDRILETTVTIIHHALDCQGCCLYLHDPHTGDLTLNASSGWGRRQHETDDLAVIDRLSRKVLRKRQPVNLSYVENGVGQVKTPMQEPGTGGAGAGEEELLKGTSIRSVLVVPMITQNNLIGTLSIDDQRHRAFGPSEGRLLTIAAAQVSVAIENARLMRSLQDRAMQLEQAIEELRELHRLKTEFIQNVSHELRTPLTFVKSYVQLILEEAMGEINPDLRKTLTIVDHRTDAIIRLVNDVISLEQVELGKFEFRPISLAIVAAHSVEGAAMAAKKANLTLELETADEIPMVNADPGRLGQVFDNLLGNAIKFSPPGGSIKVRVWHAGNFVRADVQDHGIGIPGDKLDRIFDRFYQVDGSTTRRYGGTGLGLAIVKTILEAHGGQISVESEVGAGSTFSIVLPVLPIDGSANPR